LSLPVRSDDLLGDDLPGPSAAEVRALERRYGNSDLMRALEIAGPFEVLSPWELRAPDGRHLINAGGYAALPFGERYPPLVAFIRRYLEAERGMSLPQQSASAWRGALAANLVALLARGAPSHADSQVFFSNSGAEAVETAIKLVRAARPKARRLINFSRGYHGKTLGALSLTPNDEYQALFRPLLADIITLPYGDTQALTDAFRQPGAAVGAVVVEPVQGEGGVITPPPDFLPELGRLAERYGALVVADEIQSGLGRCGFDFASVALGLEPDIITLAKPLGGGLVPIGATVARREIMQKMLGGLSSKRHSNTFGGGSLAMAVGLKSLELIEDEGLAARSRALGARGLARLQSLAAAYPGFFGEVRGAGMLFALQLRAVLPRAPLGAELTSQLGSALALRTLHLAGIHACYTLNAARTVRLTPALNLPEPLFDELFRRLEQAAQQPQASQLLRTPPATLARLARLALRG
jgi:putrescine aminotransferase